MNWLICYGIRGAWRGSPWKARAISLVHSLWQRELETSIIEEDGSQSGLQPGAARAIANCAWQKVYLHAPHLKTFAPHCVFGPLGLLGAAWQPRTCGSLFPGAWKEIVSRPLELREEEAAASKLSWRKLLILSGFISLDLLELGMEARPPPRAALNMDIGGQLPFLLSPRASSP